MDKFLAKYVTRGTVSSALSLAAFGAAVFGKSGLSAFFTNPDTAAAVLSFAGAAGTLYAGIAQGVVKG